MIFRIPGYDYEYYFNAEVIDTCTAELKKEMVKLYLCVIVFDSYTYDNKPDYLEKAIKNSREHISQAAKSCDTFGRIVHSQIVVTQKDDKYIVLKNFYGECDVEVFVVE